MDFFPEDWLEFFYGALNMQLSTRRRLWIFRKTNSCSYIKILKCEKRQNRPLVITDLSIHDQFSSLFTISGYNSTIEATKSTFFVQDVLGKTFNNTWLDFSQGSSKQQFLHCRKLCCIKMKSYLPSVRILIVRKRQKVLRIVTFLDFQINFSPTVLAGFSRWLLQSSTFYLSKTTRKNPRRLHLRPNRDSTKMAKIVFDNDICLHWKSYLSITVGIISSMNASISSFINLEDSSIRNSIFFLE